MKNIIITLGLIAIGFILGFWYVLRNAKCNCQNSTTQTIKTERKKVGFNHSRETRKSPCNCDH